MFLGEAARCGRSSVFFLEIVDGAHHGHIGAQLGRCYRLSGRSDAQIGVRKRDRVLSYPL